MTGSYVWSPRARPSNPLREVYHDGVAVDAYGYTIWNPACTTRGMPSRHAWVDGPKPPENRRPCKRCAALRAKKGEGR